MVNHGPLRISPPFRKHIVSHFKGNIYVAPADGWNYSPSPPLVNTQRKGIVGQSHPPRVLATNGGNPMTEGNSSQNQPSRDRAVQEDPRTIRPSCNPMTGSATPFQSSPQFNSRPMSSPPAFHQSTRWTRSDPQEFDETFDVRQWLAAIEASLERVVAENEWSGLGKEVKDSELEGWRRRNLDRVWKTPTRERAGG